MSSAIRSGDWKLVRGYGSWLGGNADEDVKLFRLYQDGAPNDIGEAQDVSRQYPEIRNRLLADLEERIAAAGQSVPHQNATGQGRECRAACANAGGVGAWLRGRPRLG